MIKLCLNYVTLIVLLGFSSLGGRVGCWRKRCAASSLRSQFPVWNCRRNDIIWCGGEKRARQRLVWAFRSMGLLYRGWIVLCAPVAMVLTNQGIPVAGHPLQMRGYTSGFTRDPPYDWGRKALTMLGFSCYDPPTLHESSRERRRLNELYEDWVLCANPPNTYGFCCPRSVS